MLTGYVQKTKGISAQLVVELLEAADTPQNVREHCGVVSAVAARMAARLNILGYCLDTELCRSAAALHDMCRVQEHHSRKAAVALRSYGYDAVARVVEEHDGFSGIDPEVFTESLIVCTADKLVKHTGMVMPEQRYASGMERFPATSDIGARIRADLEVCKHVVARYEGLTGDCLCAGGVTR
jgi:hypothetical protein